MQYWHFDILYLCQFDLRLFRLLSLPLLHISSYFISHFFFRFALFVNSNLWLFGPKDFWNPVLLTSIFGRFSTLTSGLFQLCYLDIWRFHLCHFDVWQFFSNSFWPLDSSSLWNVDFQTFCPSLFRTLDISFLCHSVLQTYCPLSFRPSDFLN